MDQPIVNYGASYQALDTLDQIDLETDSPALVDHLLDVFDEYAAYARGQEEYPTADDEPLTEGGHTSKGY